MAVAITTSASTLEAQVFECFQILQTLELAIEEANRPNQTTIVPDFEGQTVVLTLTVPFSFQTNAGGKLEMTVGEYL